MKIAPDLADADIDAVADLALDLGLDGIIATNTTISRAGLRDSAAVADAGPGGMSGAPLRGRALEVLRRLHDRTGDRLVLIAAGGIESADDARERLAAGATLLQAYTAFIYEGPLWPHRVQAALAGCRGRPGRRIPGPRAMFYLLKARLLAGIRSLVALACTISSRVLLRPPAGRMSASLLLVISLHGQDGRLGGDPYPRYRRGPVIATVSCWRSSRAEPRRWLRRRVLSP